MYSLSTSFNKVLRLALVSSAALIVSVAAIFPAHAADIATTYDNSCAACHESGALGALKKGDSHGWQKLKQQKGMPALVKSVKNGMTQMPAGGLCDSCSDEDYRKLIDYMSQ